MINLAKFLLVWGLLGTMTQLVASEKTSSNESEMVVQQEFGSGKPGYRLKRGTDKGVSFAEICFDKCEYFEWKRTKNSARSWDFIVLYEMKHGYGAGSELMNRREYALEVAAKNADFCRMSKEANSFDCDWGKFANVLKIRVALVTYDEGQKCTAWRDLATMEWPNSNAWKCN